jgi:hypothetical protein
MLTKDSITFPWRPTSVMSAKHAKVGISHLGGQSGLPGLCVYVPEREEEVGWQSET